MQTALDLDKRAWSRTLGNITLIGTWIRNPDGAWRPCMALVRAGEEFNAIPCIVPLDMAWVWDDRSGKGDPRTAARTAMEFAKALRLDSADWRPAAAIATLIADHIDDLVAMPPLPPGRRDVIGEAGLTDRSTGKTYEAEVMA